MVGYAELSKVFNKLKRDLTATVLANQSLSPNKK